MTIVSLQVPGADPRRLLRDWAPGAWVGAARQAFGGVSVLSSTPQGEIVDNHPPHWLIALWKPQTLQQPFLRRWPEVVLLQPADSEAQAVLALLRQLPDPQPLWVLSEDLDWPLLADIVLRSEPLHDYQRRELEAFAEAERAAVRERIAWAYGRDHRRVRLAHR